MGVDGLLQMVDVAERRKLWRYHPLRCSLLTMSVDVDVGLGIATAARACTDIRQVLTQFTTAENSRQP